MMTRTSAAFACMDSNRFLCQAKRTLLPHLVESVPVLAVFGTTRTILRLESTAVTTTTKRNSGAEERKARRDAQVAAKRERKRAARAKEAEVKAYQDELAQKVLKRQEEEQALNDATSTVETEEQRAHKLRMRSQKRQHLSLEAGAMSRSLFRTCLRCVKIMREGNEHDEADFREREENQFQSMKDAVASGTFSMAPPVDRENELESRAVYYHGHTRENFDGDSDCLKPDPWREENVDLYLRFLRSGEDKRKWVMNDYKFQDPYGSIFDHDRVDRWEAQARELLKETYDSNGWVLPSVLRETYDATGWKDDEDDDNQPNAPWPT